MIVNKEKKNWMNIDIKYDINFEKSRDSFIIKKLKNIFLKWNIIFFKLINLKKKKIKISKINLSKNTFIFFFKNIKNLNIVLQKNKTIWEKKINVLSINYNGYYINFNIIERWKFSKEIIEKIYINLFIKLICGLIIKILLNLIIKSLFYIRYNFITLNLQKNV